jgi:hypothetical protein
MIRIAGITGPARILARSALCIIVVYMYTGCKSSNIITPSDLNVTWDLCTPVTDTNYKEIYNVALMPDSIIRSEVIMPVFFHKRDIMISNASATLPYMKSLLLAAGNGINSDSAFMFYLSKVEKGNTSIRTQVEAILSELECEIFRTRQLYVQLRNLNSKNNARLTVGAIVLGSAANITPVFITQKTPQNIIIVGSSLLSAALSLSTLRTGSGKVELLFSRNLLSDIWFAPAKSINYSAGIWYILNNPEFSNTRRLSKVQLIKMRWLKFELNHSVNNNIINLYFGNGGIFDQDELEVRFTMLSELMAEVNTINVDLDNFEYDLNHLREYEFNNSKPGIH